LLSGEFQDARQWARRAVDLGTQYDPAVAAIGRVAEARSRILTGDVAQGLSLLNEAAVAVVSGELDPLLTGMVYCEVVCAFQALGQYDLAEEWTAAMERWCGTHPVGSIHGRCRVHRAEILRLRGASPEAEREALLACEELRPYLRRELGWPLTELGRIRLRRGDIEGAEQAFRSAHEVAWDPQPGLALVHLARGDVARASRSIRDALESAIHVPSKELPPNTELRRAPLLEAQVEIAVAAGDLELARASADDLSGIAARFESKALAAGAALARGRVGLAQCDVAGARREYEDAARMWSEVGAPHETALARMGLGHAHRAGGNEERAILEFQAARSAFERVGDVHRAADAVRAGGGAGGDAAPEPPRPGVHPATDPRAAGENVFRREGDYWCVAFEGRVVRIRDRKGLRYLARLLADPGREFHVIDMVAAEGEGQVEAGPGANVGAATAALDAGVMLDAQAKNAYRRRLAEIEEDIEAARAAGDRERAAQARAERDFIVRELSRAFGIGGRERRAGSHSERARASVTRAVRQAMGRIHEHHAALGQHLDRAIRTGTYCVYLPDPRIPTAWSL
jgi:tetratricopeptide (TPR) repeat protein